MKAYIYIFSLALLIFSFGCEKTNVTSNVSYNEKANELLKQVLNESSSYCILEIPNKSLIKADQEEMPGRYKNIKEELIKKLELKNESELDSLEKLSDSFILDKNFISQKGIKIIDDKTFSDEGVLKLSKKCPNGIYCLKRPMFDKEYKTAVLDFCPVFFCLNQIVVYKYINGKWIRK